MRSHAGVIAAGFSPLDLEGLQFLYDHLSERRANNDGSGSLVTTDGTAFKYWEDRSGNGLHISNSSTNVPKLELNGSDGYSDFTSDILSTSWSPGAISGDYSLHVLMRRTTDSFVQLCTFTASGGTGVFAQPWTADNFQFPSGKTNGRGWPGKCSRSHFFSIVRQSGTVTFYVNGYPTDTVANSDSFTPDTIQLGRQSTTTYTNLGIASIAFATEAHTSAQVLAYRDWLRGQFPTEYGKSTNLLYYLGNSLGTEQFTGNGGGLMTKVSSGGLAPSFTYWLNGSRGARQGAQMLSEYQTMVVPQAGETTGRTVIFLWEGTNDMTAGGLTPTQAAQNLFDLSAGLQANISNCKVVIGTVIDRNATDFAAKKAEINGYILDSGNQSTYDYTVADFTGIATVSDDGAYANTTYFNVDGVHLKAAGYDQIKSTVGTAVEAALTA